MKIVHYADAIIHTLVKSDEGAVTFPKTHCLKPEKASHEEIWPLALSLNKQKGTSS